MSKHKHVVDHRVGSPKNTKAEAIARIVDAIVARDPGAADLATEGARLHGITQDDISAEAFKRLRRAAQ